MAHLPFLGVPKPIREKAMAAINKVAKAQGKVAAFKADYEAAKKAEAIGESTEALKKYKAAKYELEKLPSHTGNKTERLKEIEVKIKELESTLNK